MSFDEEIEDDTSVRKKDHGQLTKQKNPSLDALEHRVRRKERQAGEALKNVGQTDLGFYTPRVLVSRVCDT
jgi:hypothetical protein